MDNRGIDTDPGWINRKIHALERAIEGLRSERRAAATTVSEGDFIVSGGGSIRVQTGGDVVAEGGVIKSLGDLIAGEQPVAVMQGGALLVGTLDEFGVFINAGLTSVYPNQVQVQTDLGSLLLTTDAVTGDGELSSSTGRVKINHTTTANAANVHMDTNGVVFRSTSSRRYKQDERPADIDTAAVLALQPRVFRSRDEVDALGDDAPTHAGFVAEEAADLGLDHWVTRDEDGEPEAFAYSQFCVAQQAVIQAQQAQIDDLAEKVATLTAKQQTTTRST